MKYSEISRMKYDIEDPFLKGWAMKYGVIDTFTKVWQCLLFGFGYMGSKRIDSTYLNKLSENDIKIYNAVVDWVCSVNKN